jgi:hypothetical protein
MPQRPARSESEQPGIWKRFQMPAKNVCEPTQFDGVGAHGRAISIDLDPDQPAPMVGVDIKRK